MWPRNYKERQTYRKPDCIVSWQIGWGKREYWEKIIKK